ncbi:uncharacterized protein Z519_12284 [Cladophialophora bantiana CBS 173.52]|uniref:Cupin type-2 domain-containing protein n=1 Tax=Cladophialophora bantiana (strain ATCC 10958 / CBS 173.52 / CDC B-1940 / NIH 8579) TaxID=1442370 RepID=A0A0D2H1M6_CLAB1|nr:uncharacterized protein Z519_12284 [Cladophialophora bantiana CBS 173.52]KIW87173.1 hypothetical protein Z519_12284 [Cladophialophora bantiana CBS 173.52]
MSSDGLQPALNYGMRQCARYITKHADDGTSVFGDSPDLLYRDRGGYAITRNYAATSVPMHIENETDCQAYLSSDRSQEASYVHAGQRVTVSNGLNFLTVDLGPGAQTPMHRTISVDFVTVIEGRVELLLDSGESQVLESGDAIIQRATMHRWKNPSSDKPARFVAVVIDMRAHEVNGKLLEQEYLRS